MKVLYDSFPYHWSLLSAEAIVMSRIFSLIFFVVVGTLSIFKSTSLNDLIDSVVEDIHTERFERKMKIQLTKDKHPSKLDQNVDKKEQLQLLIRAFKRLSDEERSRLNVDLNQNIEVGSEAATSLMEVWNTRQQELKYAIDNMVKPVDYMKDLLEGIEHPTISATSDNNNNGNNNIKYRNRTANLIELESMVDDIDNARDFYAIGGWSTLCEIVENSNDYSSPDRALAAWVQGSAIKSDYDCQLWVLETINSSSAVDKTELSSYTCLSALILLLKDGNEEEQRKALYAISSASRGNMDVQQALQANNLITDSLSKTSQENITSTRSTVFSLKSVPIIISILDSIVAQRNNTFELQRKIWAFVRDMLEEAAYLNRLAFEEWLITNNGDKNIQIDEKVQWNDVSPGIVITRQGFIPLGRHFCNVKWASNAVEQLHRMNQNFKVSLAKSTGNIHSHEIIKSSINLVKYLKRELNKLFGEDQGRDKMNPKQSDLISIRATMESIMESIMSSILACDHGDLNPIDNSDAPVETWMDVPLRDNLALILKDIATLGESGSHNNQSQDNLYAQAIVILRDLAKQVLEKISQ